MSASGIQCAASVQAGFALINKTKPDARFVTFGIENDEIVHKDAGSATATWDDFVEMCKDDQPCYALFHYEYQTTDGRTSDAMLFIAWVPDRAKIKQKMQYASSKEALKKALGGGAGLIDLQAGDKGDLDPAQWKSKLRGAV